MRKREQIVELYPEETFLFADGFDEAIIGVDSKNLVIIYDEELCIQKLEKEMSREDAEEFFHFNVIGSHMGEKTPVFIQLLKSTIIVNEDTHIYESPDGGKTIYRRNFGEYTKRELV
tara:strand:- start:2471 stop:2821 length:351 start_codon:yes stop_codon:yes gene_type:complete